MDTWHILQIHTRHRACTDDCTQVEFPSGTAFLSARSQRLSRQTDCLPVKGYHGKTIENSWMWHWSCFLLAGASFYSLQKVKVKIKQRGPAQKATDSASALALFILKGTSPVSCSFRPTSWAPLDDDTAGSTSSPRTSSPCIRCVVRIVEPATSAACSETANGVQHRAVQLYHLRSCQIWARACEGWPGGVKLQDQREIGRKIRDSSALAVVCWIMLVEQTLVPMSWIPVSLIRPS